MSKLSKIINFNELKKIRSQFKSKKIILCHGVFDLFHLGHLNYLKLAKKHGDLLIVSITKDEFVNKGPNRPFYKEDKRIEMIAALEIVNFIVINIYQSPIKLIKNLKPNFYIKGKDYKNLKSDKTGEIYNEKKAIEKIGGKLITTESELLSSSNLINNYSNFFSSSQKKQLNLINSDYSLKEIETYISKISNIKIQIIGEPIIDRYILAKPKNLASKSPCISSSLISEENHLGGVFGIANNALELGCNVTSNFILGKNDNFKKIINTLASKKMKFDFIETNDYYNVVKTRYIDPFHKQKMFEIAITNEKECSNDNYKKLIKKIELNSKKNDLILIADFGHYCINNEIASKLDKIKKFKSINVQSNSQNLGFNLLSKYNNFQICCIDEKELRLNFRNRDSNIKDILLKHKLKKDQLLSITLDKNGSISKQNSKFYSSCSFANNVRDTIGAGDAYLLMNSLLHFLECPIELNIFLSNVYAGLATQIHGNSSSIKLDYYLRTIEFMLK